MNRDDLEKKREEVRQLFEQYADESKRLQGRYAQLTELIDGLDSVEKETVSKENTSATSTRSKSN